MPYREGTYQSQDGLNLYFRTYGNLEERPPILCLSGLTRNSGDFDRFAERYSKDRIVYALDYRGRGNSDYDPHYQNYNPQTYLGDIFSFLNHQGIEKALFVGTSLGGMLTMGFAGLAKQYIHAVLLNDVGPEIASSGESRIAGYVGQDVRFPSIEEAARAQKEQYLGAYPDVPDEEWLRMAKPAFILDQTAGNYRPNYDLAIGKALAEQLTGEEKIDLWPFFEGLKDIPTLALRGALSDVLSEETFAKMLDIHPDMETLVLQNRGHVPLLDEPEALAIMDPFFARY
ncbi:MAG: alpha/beta hydrolase [Sneathiellales bacterium]|nr:alpha/beta hydrolase [Sneathiellales bacterium]